MFSLWPLDGSVEQHVSSTLLLAQKLRLDIRSVTITACVGVCGCVALHLIQADCY